MPWHSDSHLPAAAASYYLLEHLIIHGDFSQCPVVTQTSATVTITQHQLLSFQSPCLLSLSLVPIISKAVWKGRFSLTVPQGRGRALRA